MCMSECVRVCVRVRVCVSECGFISYFISLQVFDPICVYSLTQLDNEHRRVTSFLTSGMYEFEVPRQKRITKSMISTCKLGQQQTTNSNYCTHDEDC